mgnify:CR=1 FL=1
MLARIDLHVHTCYSSDARMGLEELLEALERHDLRAAITDHNTVEGALRLKRWAPDRIIVGEEIRTAEGEILAYFLEEAVPPFRELEETVELVHRQGGIVSIPHPFDPFRRHRLRTEALLRALRLVDALEVFNARNLLRRSNLKALRMADRLKLGRSAGSDAHTLGEIGNGVTGVAADERTLDDVLEAIRKGKVAIQRENPFKLTERIAYYGVKVRDLLLHGRRYMCTEEG